MDGCPLIAEDAARDRRAALGEPTQGARGACRPARPVAPPIGNTRALACHGGATTPRGSSPEAQRREPVRTLDTELVSKLEHRARIDLGDLGIGELLALSRRILAELRRRGVIRSGNAPAGDYAELLAQRATIRRVRPNSQRSWDGLARATASAFGEGCVVTDPRVHAERQPSAAPLGLRRPQPAVLRRRVPRGAPHGCPSRPSKRPRALSSTSAATACSRRMSCWPASDATKPEPKGPMKPTRVTKTVKVTTWASTSAPCQR